MNNDLNRRIAEALDQRVVMRAADGRGQSQDAAGWHGKASTPSRAHRPFIFYAVG